MGQCHPVKYHQRSDVSKGRYDRAKSVMRSPCRSTFLHMHNILNNPQIFESPKRMVWSCTERFLPGSSLHCMDKHQAVESCQLFRPLQSTVTTVHVIYYYNAVWRKQWNKLAMVGERRESKRFIPFRNVIQWHSSGLTLFGHVAASSEDTFWCFLRRFKKRFIHCLCQGNSTSSTWLFLWQPTRGDVRWVAKKYHDRAIIYVDTFAVRIFRVRRSFTATLADFVPEITLFCTSKQATLVFLARFVPDNITLLAGVLFFSFILHLCPQYSTLINSSRRQTLSITCPDTPWTYLSIQRSCQRIFCSGTLSDWSRQFWLRTENVQILHSAMTHRVVVIAKSHFTGTSVLMWLMWPVGDGYSCTVFWMSGVLITEQLLLYDWLGWRFRHRFKICSPTTSIYLNGIYHMMTHLVLWGNLLLNAELWSFPGVLYCTCARYGLSSSYLRFHKAVLIRQVIFQICKIQYLHDI